MLVAFVPARGGSKGIPRKNLAPLAGKPLIQYTLEAAKKSAYIDEIFLSTDDEEIADFCREHGVDTTYRRPNELASDTASMRDAVVHGLQWLENKKGRMPEALILLQPTSPLRTYEDIDNAVQRFRAAGTDTLVSVHPMTEHPCECVVEGAEDWHYLVSPPLGAGRRQDYPQKFYFINGAIYITRIQHLLKGGGFVVPGRSVFYEMPAHCGIDVDTELNLAAAEGILLSLSKELRR